MSKGKDVVSGRSERDLGRFWPLMAFVTVVTTMTLLFFLAIGATASILFTQEGGVRWPFLAAGASLTLLIMVSQILAHNYHGRILFPLYLASSIAMGVLFYSTIVTSILGPMAIITLLTGADDVRYMLRYLFIIGIIAPVIWGLIEARTLRVRRAEVGLKGLKKGVKAALVSDLHLGLLVGAPRLRKVLSVLERERPDFIVIAGDLFDTHPRFNRRYRELLRRFRSIAPVYVTFGNHEMFNGHVEIVEEIELLGFTLLRNRWVKDEGPGIYMAGIDDPSFFRSSKERERTLVGILESIPEGVPVILVDHQPVLFKVAARTRSLLQLSGHTHAGQLWPASYITKKVYHGADRGLHTIGSSHMFVCVGTGTWGPPMRVGAPPEMIILDIETVQ